jgi:Periplasmic binding protein domain
MAFSVSERELLGAHIAPVGHLVVWNYFNSINSAENDVFVKTWADFTGQRDTIVTERPRLTPPLLGRSIAWLADRRRDPTPINRHPSDECGRTVL